MKLLLESHEGLCKLVFHCLKDSLTFFYDFYNKTATLVCKLFNSFLILLFSFFPSSYSAPSPVHFGLLPVNSLVLPVYSLHRPLHSSEHVSSSLLLDTP